MLKDFNETNPKTKYKSDFLNFLSESKLEDFSPSVGTEIVVSTIHKAKGREFDNVYLVQKINSTGQDKLRATYVGLTRAKTNLFVHCSNNYFDGLRVEGVNKILDKGIYSEPDEIVEYVDHKGVALGVFFRYMRDIFKVRNGDILKIQKETTIIKKESKERYFGYTQEGKRVIQFSDEQCRKIDERLSKGYSLSHLTVRLLIWWRKVDITSKKVTEALIILPDIHYKKNKI